MIAILLASPSPLPVLLSSTRHDGSQGQRRGARVQTRRGRIYRQGDAGLREQAGRCAWHEGADHGQGNGELICAASCSFACRHFSCFLVRDRQTSIISLVYSMSDIINKEVFLIERLESSVKTDEKKQSMHHLKVSRGSRCRL